MSSYGVAGSNPLALPTVTIEKLLSDAIRSKWDSDYVTPLGITYPLASNIYWLQVWRTGYNDIELCFLHGFLDSPSDRKTTDERMEGHIYTVDCHIFVRGPGGDVQPTALAKVMNGLETVVSKNKNTDNLIPNMQVRIASSQPAATEEESDFKSLWHYLMKMRVSYWTDSTV